MNTGQTHIVMFWLGKNSSYTIWVEDFKQSKHNSLCSKITGLAKKKTTHVSASQVL